MSRLYIVVVTTLLACAQFPGMAASLPVVLSLRCIAMNVYHNNAWLTRRRYDFDGKQVARKLNYCNKCF